MPEKENSSAVAPSLARIERQAIVLVHGMGEQIPMQTVRDFAHAVWETDEDLHASAGKTAGELFSVPDANAGSRELRRISTRKSRPRVGTGKRSAVRSEFFELYWADSTEDTKWADFLSWYARLVLRPWSDVPSAVKEIWILLWFVNVAFILSAEIAALWLVTTEIDALFMDTIKSAGKSGQQMSWIATSWQALQTPTTKATLYFIWAPLLAATCGYLVHRAGMFRKVALWVALVGGFVAVWSIVVLLALMLKPYVFLTSKQHDVFWPGFMALCGAALLLIQGFLIKFFGDVARYTFASPGNIVPRQKVRDRGIALINQLRASGRYDRIIVVAHSLGCVIAYDIVCLLWSDYVATRDKPPELVPSADRVLDEVRAVEAAALDQPMDLALFRRAQRALFRSLREADRMRLAKDPTAGAIAPPWLISDLVTIANPLTHAEFLLAKNKTQLEQRFDARELAKCPPAMQDFHGRKSFVYASDGSTTLRFNHDAAFAAVRWTSIHDRPARSFAFLLGDFISGPVRGLFGQGVVDLKVEPRWAAEPMPERFFTHTIYWEMRQAHAAWPPPSVQVVRAALNLLDEDGREKTLLDEARRSPCRPGAP